MSIVTIIILKISLNTDLYTPSLLSPKNKGSDILSLE